jgi:nucleoside-diphosphate-sugar epimerase
MPTRVLVTGGAGYLGSILCEHLLAAGYQVTAVDNLMYGQRSLFHFCAQSSFDFVRGDVRDESLMRRLIDRHDVLLPLAAIVGAPACDRDPWLAQAVNRDAIALLNRLRSRQQLVLFPVTNSGYGTKSGNVYCTEDSPLTPLSLYGRTKVEAEAELLGSPNVITLRLATVFGMSPRLRLDLLVNHFTYAANMSKHELALKIREQLPELVIQCSEIGEDPDKRNYIVSNQRLRDAGFEARRSLDQGIAELIKGYRMLPRSPYYNV